MIVMLSYHRGKENHHHAPDRKSFLLKASFHKKRPCARIEESSMVLYMSVYSFDCQRKEGMLLYGREPMFLEVAFNLTISYTFVENSVAYKG
jgi:hypothetical protein